MAEATVSPTHRREPLVRVRPVMGTMASLHVHDDRPDDEIDVAVEAVWQELERLEALFSTFRRDSQISEVNRGERHLLDCDAEVIEVLDACTWLEHTSGGAFRSRRPDAPDQLDPAGFVKGWATERASHQLAGHGLHHWYLSVGGDLVAHGSPAPGQPWRIAIADPLHARQVLGVIELTDGAVATSGTAERGAHLWDGRTGAPPSDFVAVTVTGPSLSWADALATAAFAMGEDGPTWVSTFDGYAAIAVRPDGSHTTRGALAA